MSYGKRKTDLAALVDTTPDGYTCGLIRDFVVLATSSDPYTIQWSAIGDHTDWPIPGTDDARSKQAGSQTFPTKFGIVTGIAGNDFFGYVFQERAITKMTYVGGDVVFSFDTFEENRGCFDIGRFEQSDDTVFFQSEAGYHSITNDQILNIGLARVDDTYPPTRTATITGGNGTIMEAVAVNKNIGCVFFQNNDLCYNYNTDQWMRMPTFNGGKYYSLDSNNGIIGRAVFSGSAVDLQSSSGAPASTATCVTGEANLNVGGRAVVDSIRPQTDGGSLASLRVGVRDLYSDSVTWATGTALNSRTGRSNFRGGANLPEGRYHRAEFIFTGGFTTVSGAVVDFVEVGNT